MHPEWQAFLESRGARFDDHDGEVCVADFGAPADASLDIEPSGPELADLSPLGLLRIEGPDAASFFQGYATSDVSVVAADRARASALCTREGRTIATFRIWGPSDALTLRLHRALTVPVRDLLAHYIVFSDAELAAPGDEVIGIGLAGPGSRAIIAELFGAPPEENQVATRDGPHGTHTAVRNRGELERFEIWLPRADAPDVYDALAAQAQPIPFARWMAHRIRAGYIELSPRTAGEFVPQALNLQATGLVSFDKGCYLGQEVVARLQHLGKTKKRLFRFSLPSPQGQCPLLGAEITLGDDEGEVVGEVVAAASDAGRCEMLAVVRVDRAAEALCVGTRVLTSEPLPYEVPEPRAASRD